MVALRQCKDRASPFVFPYNSDGVETVKKVTTPSTQLYADEALHWEVFYACNEMHGIKHGETHRLNGV